MLQLSDETQRKPLGEVYTIAVMAGDLHPDGTTETHTQLLTILSGGVHVTPSGGEAVYTGGTALIDEDADGTAAPIVIGTVADDAGSSRFIGFGARGYSINASNELVFSGAEAGDFDTDDHPILTIQGFDADGNATHRYFYTVNTTNTDDSDPVVTLVEGIANAAENTTDVVAQVQATDADNVAGATATDTTTFELATGATVIQLSALDGSNGFRLDGDDEGDEAGASVSLCRRY